MRVVVHDAQLPIELQQCAWKSWTTRDLSLSDSSLALI